MLWISYSPPRKKSRWCLCMYSHPLKPVKQLSSQTMQDTASQNYKTYWNYSHSNHNNNMPGWDLQGGGGSSCSSSPLALVLPAAPSTGRAAPMQHAVPRPTATSSTLTVHAALWFHPKHNSHPHHARKPNIYVSMHTRRRAAELADLAQGKHGQPLHKLFHVALLKSPNPDMLQPSQAQVFLVEVLNQAVASDEHTEMGMKTPD